jgi:NAD+ kinase
MIIHDERTDRARDMRDDLDRVLPEGFEDPEIIIVVGGDGFLLQTIQRFGLEKTYLGLNAGHLGFLLNDVTLWDHTAEQLRTRAWTTWGFPLLVGDVELLDGTHVPELAVNDIYLERMTGQTARLRVTVDGRVAVEELVADGILTSTALGSTGYNFSAGGPACHPTLAMMTVTPICAHHPRLPPFVLPKASVVEVDVHPSPYRPVRVSADGRQIENVCRLVVRFADREVRLAYLDGHDFTARMLRKILHP